jgi:hypothetical protein
MSILVSPKRVFEAYRDSYEKMDSPNTLYNPPALWKEVQLRERWIFFKMALKLNGVTLFYPLWKRVRSIF